LGSGQNCSRATAILLADEVIKRAGKRRTDRIIVIGCEHIELLVQLVRTGFIDVTCRSALGGPNAGEMSADIIIAPAADREAEPAAVISRMGHSLRSGGFLILVAAATPFRNRIRQLQRLLIQHGFTFSRRAVAPAHLNLLCCRKLPTIQTHAA
jgi:hypothetical protein